MSKYKSPGTLRIGLFLDGPNLCHLKAVNIDSQWHVSLLSQVYLVGGVEMSTQRSKRGPRNVVTDVSTTERLDIMSNQWEPLDPTPQPRTRMAAVATMGRLYLMGGLHKYHTLDTADCLDLLTGKWQTNVFRLPVAKAACAATALGERIYIVGGSSDGRHILTTMERFDLFRKAWSDAPPMKYGRTSFAAAALGGRIYAIGGRDAEMSLSSAECYDPADNCWREIRPMRLPRFDFPAAAVVDRILCVGGFSEDHRVLGSVESYSPAENSWEMVRPLPHPVASCAAVASQGKVYVLGGSNGQRTLTRSLCLDLRAGVEGPWEPLPAMQTKRMAAVAATAFFGEGGRLRDPRRDA